MTDTTVVKSTARSERMRAQWADPAFRAKMADASKRGAATTNARRKKPDTKIEPPAPEAAKASDDPAKRPAPVPAAPDPPQDEGAARPKGWRPWKTRSA